MVLHQQRVPQIKKSSVQPYYDITACQCFPEIKIMLNPKILRAKEEKGTNITISETRLGFCALEIQRKKWGGTRLCPRAVA